MNIATMAGEREIVVNAQAASVFAALTNPNSSYNGGATIRSIM